MNVEIKVHEILRKRAEWCSRRTWRWWLVNTCAPQKMARRPSSRSVAARGVMWPQLPSPCSIGGHGRRRQLRRTGCGLTAGAIPGAVLRCGPGRGGWSACGKVICSLMRWPRSPWGLRGNTGMPPAPLPYWLWPACANAFSPGRQRREEP